VHTVQVASSQPAVDCAKQLGVADSPLAKVLIPELSSTAICELQKALSSRRRAWQLLDDQSEKCCPSAVTTVCRLNARSAPVLVGDWQLGSSTHLRLRSSGGTRLHWPNTPTTQGSQLPINTRQCRLQ
jgi:hypothetical protein